MNNKPKNGAAAGEDVKALGGKVFLPAILVFAAHIADSALTGLSSMAQEGVVDADEKLVHILLTEIADLKKMEETQKRLGMRFSLPEPYGAVQSQIVKALFQLVNDGLQEGGRLSELLGAEMASRIRVEVE